MQFRSATFGKKSIQKKRERKKERKRKELSEKLIVERLHCWVGLGMGNIERWEKQSQSTVYLSILECLIEILELNKISIMWPPQNFLL